MRMHFFTILMIMRVVLLAMQAYYRITPAKGDDIIIGHALAAIDAAEAWFRAHSPTDAPAPPNDIEAFNG